MAELGESENSKLLKEFIWYCHTHPQERFWQALRNWAELKAIYAVRIGATCSCGKNSVDPFSHNTFDWENKNG